MIPIKINLNNADDHFEKLKALLTKRINDVVVRGIKIKTGRRKSLICTSALKTFLQSLTANNQLELSNLIKMEPKLISNYIQGLKASNPTFFDKKKNDYKIIYNIFIQNAYERYIDKFWFISTLEIDTCAYCNRNYIYTVDKTKKVKPEIDHFYPKELYPIMGASYFNLIPSCEPCNGVNSKHRKDPFIENFISPYLIKDDDFQFTFSINNINIINPLSSKFDIDVIFFNKIQENCDTFNLDDLYSKHNDHVLELIIKDRIKYSKKYREHLNSFIDFKFSENEINRMILGNYTLKDEQHKRPLTKMYQDIGTELGLI
jgi:5-methylcytosine-specific restriction endonuclease McrA